MQVTQKESELKIKMLCLATGSTRVIVRIPLSPAVGELTFSLNKICDPKREVAERNRETSKSKLKSLPIDIKSSSDGAVDVVDAGIVALFYSTPWFL